ncbi:MAG: helix-turn-helix domain-containing protein [Clostridiales bacterium]|nr:helix-turn-helix domain-containing protein [Clostridiales bacterium]
MDMEQFGEYLAECRRNKKMTQEEFSCRLGVTAQAVSKWERGQSFPDIGLLSGICKILEADPCEMLGVPRTEIKLESNNRREQEELLSNLCAEPLQIIFGEDLIPVFAEGIPNGMVAEKRVEVIRKAGILVPVIWFRDRVELGKREYCILSYDKVLVQKTVETITKDTYETLIDEIFAQCVEHYDTILNKQLVKNLVDHVREEYPGVVEGVVPEKISYLFIKKVLAEMVREKKNIHNTIGILEGIEEEVLEKGNTNIKEIAKLL